MKTKNKISKTKAWSNLLFFMLSLLVFTTACTDDISTHLDDNDEDFTGIILRVSESADLSVFNMSGETTRTIEGAEGDYANIYLLAVNAGNSSVNAISLSELLTPADGKLDNSTVRKAKVQLFPGDYRFYVVANLNSYIKDSTVEEAFATESDITDFINDFSTDVPLIPGLLPMVCEHSNISSTDGKNWQGNITLSKNSAPTITADLSFLCAKVRYTILFDASSDGISSAFDNKRLRILLNETNHPSVGYKAGQEFFKELKGVIVNGDFPPGQENPSTWVDWKWEYTVNGWSGTEFTDAGNGIVEQYNKIFNNYQDISSRKPGYYRLEVQGFYRYGWASSAFPSHNNGTEKLLAKIYISKVGSDQERSESSLMSLYNVYYGNSESYYPGDYNSAYNALSVNNYYNGNTVDYKLNEEGPLRVGVYKDEIMAGDWTCFDNFRLYYKSFETEQQVEIRLDPQRYVFDASTAGMNNNNFDYKSWLETNLKEWDSSKGNLDEWYAREKNAWQGMVYLPPKECTLSFPYTFKVTDGEPAGTQTVTINPTPGNMLDLIILIKSPDNFQGVPGELDIQVIVNEWDREKVEMEW